MTLVLGLVGTAMALVLAWRAYRSAAREDAERKAWRKRREGDQCGRE